jgi:hypothetical protein
MSETTGQNHIEPETKTISLEGIKAYVCSVCNTESDGFTNCLHVTTSEGEELRCITCYRAYTQSQEHLEQVRKYIPVLKSKLNDAA